MSISVSSNSDGTFTVSCGTESVTIGKPGGQQATTSAQKRSGRGGKIGGKVVGGFVVCGIGPNSDRPHEAIRVLNTSELADRLKAQVSAAKIARAAGYTTLKEVHFALNGAHTLDIGELSAATGGDSSGIVTHIHIGHERGR